MESLPRGFGQSLARRNALAQRREIIFVHQPGHGPECGRCGIDLGDAIVGDGLEQRLRPARREKPGRGAEAHGKQGDSAQSERKRQGRGAADHIIGDDLAQIAGEAIGDRQNVPVEMHCALGLAGGARGERDQRHVIGRGFHIVEVVGLAVGRGFQSRLGPALGHGGEI